MQELNEKLTQSEIDYLNSNRGKLLNPRMDSTFKALFTQPTEESKIALHSFLEAVLDRKIVEVKFEPNDAVQQFGSQRDVDYDINVRFSTGEAAEIEMQAWSQNYDYGKRAEYQCARLLSTYFEEGDSWDKVQKVYQISVLDYNYFPKHITAEDRQRRTKSVLNYYRMKNQFSESLTDILNIVFIELTNLESEYTDETLQELSAGEKWALFLKNADNQNSSDLVKKLIAKEAGIMNAQSVLSSISSNRALWLAQYHAEVRKRDEISNLEGAKEMGRAEGLAEGLSKGLAEGLSKGLAEGLSKGLAEGLSKGRAEGEKNILTKLAEFSKQGLSLEEIMRLLSQ